MWLSDRRAFLALLALAGCGFTPAYGPAGGASALRGRIALAEPDDKAAFDLHARLEERLGRAEAAVYRLDSTITVKRLSGGITADNSVTRYTLEGSVNWSLVRLSTGDPALNGQVDSFTGYSATGSTVAGLAAAEDASTRLMRILADQIATQLIGAAPTLGA